MPKYSTEHGAVGQEKRARLQDLFEKAPDAWLAQLLGCLPARSRLALFRSSKQLARLVVRNATCTKLHFSTPPKWLWYVQKQPAVVARRRCIIEALLQGCHNLEVVFEMDQLQPLPMGLSNSITAIYEKDKLAARHSTLGGDYQFGSMPHLKVLSIGDKQQYDWQYDWRKAATKLCDALEAGQLPQLQHVEFNFRHHGASPDEEQKAILKRLAYAAGKQIIHLTTSHWPLLQELSGFSKLQSVAVCDSSLSDEAMTQICEHPCIRTVTFGSHDHVGCLQISSNCSQRSCKWETLILDRVLFSEIVKLPLKSVPGVRFRGRIVSFLSKDERPAFNAVVSTPNVKFVCLPEPGTGVIHFYSDAGGELQLMTKIVGAHTLYLHGSAGETPLSTTCAAVPMCISSITISTLRSTDWATFWQGFPEHVTSVSLDLCPQYSEQDVLQIVKQAPAHMRKLELQCELDGAFCNELYLAAPVQLKLVLPKWGVRPRW